MKRLFSIVLITALLGLIAFGFLWVKNEEVGQDVSEFNPMRRMRNKQETGSMMKKPTMKIQASSVSTTNTGSSKTSGEAVKAGTEVSSEVIIKN